MKIRLRQNSTELVKGYLLRDGDGALSVWLGSRDRVKYDANELWCADGQNTQGLGWLVSHAGCLSGVWTVDQFVQLYSIYKHNIPMPGGWVEVEIEVPTHILHGATGDDG